MSHLILIVEDEPDIREMLDFSLSRHGYHIVAVESAEAALAAVHEQLPELAIIDWMLPGMSGVELARRFRRDEMLRELPIIMLTARSEEVDKLRSFESGVDDYVTKPFSPRELAARVKALLRRSAAPVAKVLENGGIRMDLDSRTVNVSDAPVHLGPTEFRLLEFLLRNPERAFDRAQLLDRVWGRSAEVEERTVDVHVLRLRKALEPHGLQRLIQTVRGVGYRFSNP